MKEFSKRLLRFFKIFSVSGASSEIDWGTKEAADREYYDRFCMRCGLDRSSCNCDLESFLPIEDDNRLRCKWCGLLVDPEN